MSKKGINERNRANAQKSTGPKTEEGKNRSRCNALTHGLCADILFTDGDFGTYGLDEMRGYIEDMLANRFNELNPQTWEEVFLAKQIMSFEYRLLRCPSIEAEQLRALREASAQLYSKPGCYRDANELDKDNGQAHLRVIGIYTFLSSVYRYEKSLFSMLRETRLLYETRQAKRAYDHWRYPNPPVMNIGSEQQADFEDPITLADLEPENQKRKNEPEEPENRENPDTPNANKATPAHKDEEAQAEHRSGGDTGVANSTHNAQRTTHRPPEGLGVEVPRSRAGGGAAAEAYPPAIKEHEEAEGLPAPWDGAKRSVAQAEGEGARSAREGVPDRQTRGAAETASNPDGGTAAGEDTSNARNRKAIAESPLLLPREEEGPGVEVPRSRAGAAVAAEGHRQATKEHEEAEGLPAPDSDGGKADGPNTQYPAPNTLPKVFLRNEPKQPETADFGPSEAPIQPPRDPHQALCGSATRRTGDPNTR